jgi:glycosyltransferase involved in cell wall biosynthesis
MAGLRIVVYPHAMTVGGSQLNAIELAAAVRDLGHEVAVLGEPGPLVDQVRALDLEHLPIPRDRQRPSLPVAARLRRLIQHRRLDIVHGYEWPPGLEAAAAAFARPGTAAVCTVMSMAVAPFLPASMPLVVGTRELRDRTAAGRTGPVHLIEPPVDVVRNAPGHPVTAFRERFGLLDSDGDFDSGGGPDSGGGLDSGGGAPGRTFDLVMVCRLVPELKLEGILTAIDVVGGLARQRPVRLTIVGDGPASAAVRERADAANALTGRRAVVLTGQLDDPRPAYAAADAVLGMGGSALRGLAFGRPLVVQGERGFWELLTPQSCETFLRQGWYGLGDDDRSGADRLRGILDRLIGDGQLCRSLGDYGRELAVSRFSLQRAATVQEEIYRQALAAPPSVVAGAAEGARSAMSLAGYKVHRRYQRLRGTIARDDFNAKAKAPTG